MPGRTNSVSKQAFKLMTADVQKRTLNRIPKPTIKESNLSTERTNMTQDPLTTPPEPQPEIEAAPRPTPIEAGDRPGSKITDFLDTEAIMYVKIVQARLAYQGSTCTSAEVIERMIKAFTRRAEKRRKLYGQLT
jgi:hypothetical protein